MADPWVAVKATIRKSDGIVALPNDSARWGFIVALGETKLYGRQGSMTPEQWPELMGRFARYLDDYIRAGLVHRMPSWCHDRACMRGRGPFDDGRLVIHQWPAHQREHARRQAEYEQRLTDAPTDGWTDAGTDVGLTSIHAGAGALSPSPVVVPVINPRPGEPYQVADDGPEGPVLSWLAQRGIGIAPTGSGFHRKLVLLVERHGTDRVTEALASAMAAGARGERAVVFGAENLLDPVPSAKGAPAPRPKGYQPDPEEVRRALAR